jgi:acetyltransferase-like isoleucine patch superfamily enzyme
MTALAHDWFPQPLPDTVALGERSWLYSSYAFMHSHGTVRIGPDCGIYKGTHFELGPEGSVDIGSYCTIVGAIIRTNGHVAIGDMTFAAHEVVIADDPFAVPPRGAAEPGAASIMIGENAWIGARAILLGGTTIGDDAVVGAGAVVRGTVPAGATVVGNPAQVA